MRGALFVLRAGRHRGVTALTALTLIKRKKEFFLFNNMKAVKAVTCLSAGALSTKGCTLFVVSMKAGIMCIFPWFVGTI